MGVKIVSPSGTYTPPHGKPTGNIYPGIGVPVVPKGNSGINKVIK